MDSPPVRVVIVANDYAGTEWVLAGVTEEAESTEAILRDGGVSFQTLKNVPAAQFQADLLLLDPEVVIFCGHGDLELDAHGSLALGFVSQTGAEERPFDVVDHITMADYILAAAKKRLRMVVLNGCKTSMLAQEVTRQALSKAGCALQHIVCWRTRTEDKGACAFGAAFVRRHLVGTSEGVAEAFDGAKRDVTDKRLAGALDTGQGAFVPQFRLDDPDEFGVIRPGEAVGVPVLADLHQAQRALAVAQKVALASRGHRRHTAKWRRLAERVTRVAKFVDASAGSPPHMMIGHDGVLSFARLCEGAATFAAELKERQEVFAVELKERQRICSLEVERFDAFGKQLHEIILGVVNVYPEALRDSMCEPSWGADDEADAGADEARIQRLRREAAAKRAAAVSSAEAAEALRQAVLAPPPARWSEHSACDLCATAFRMFNRRHHCRRCGRSVCGDCSRGRVGAQLRACGPCEEAEGVRITQARAQATEAEARAVRDAKEARARETELARVSKQALSAGDLSALYFVTKGGADEHFVNLSENGRYARMSAGEGHGWAHCVTHPWPSEMSAEVTLEIGEMFGLYVGLIHATDEPLPSGELCEANGSFMMRCYTGSLYGNSERGSHVAGAVFSGSKLTLRYDYEKSTLMFLLNGTPHGPGHEDVRGPLKLCVSMNSEGSAVRLVD